MLLGSTSITMISFGSALCLVLSLCLITGSSCTDVDNEPSFRSSSSVLGALSGFELRDKTLFSVVRDFTRRHPDLVHDILIRMVNLLPDEGHRIQQMELMEQAFSDTLTVVEPPCTTCRALVQLVKILVDQLGYSRVEQGLIDLCELLFTALDQENNAKQICHTVYYQGPHVAAILATVRSDIDYNSSTAFAVCSTLNACYPNPQNVLMEPHADSCSAAERNAILRRTLANAEKEHSKRAPLRIVQISDVHIEHGYTANTNENCPLLVCCLEEHGPGNAKEYGSYRCNIPVTTLNLFIDKVISLNPDFIIFSGDAPPHRVWDETLDSQLNCSRTLTDNLKAKLANYPQLRVYPSIGNHDMYPTNLFSVRNHRNDTVAMLESYIQMWTDLANFTSDQLNTIRSGGFYTMMSPYNNIRILSINTDYMYSLNFYNVVNHKLNRISVLPPYEATQMQTNVEIILAAARRNTEKVILINHHPPGGGDYIIHTSRWYEALVVNYSDVIILQVAGHTHTDEIRLLKDSENNVKSMVYVNPSVDMHGGQNPSVRLYRIEDVSYDIIDYEQYYFDLSQLASEPPNITRLYSAAEAYGLTDFSPASWECLLKQFETNQTLLMRHRWYADAAVGAPPTSCDEPCRRRHICRQLHANLDHYDVCSAEPQQPTTPIPKPPSTTWPPLIRPENSSPPRPSISFASLCFLAIITSLLMNDVTVKVLTGTL